MLRWLHIAALCSAVVEGPAEHCGTHDDEKPGGDDALLKVAAATVPAALVLVSVLLIPRGLLDQAG